MFFFIMYFYINVTFQFKRDQWNYVIGELLNIFL